MKHTLKRRPFKISGWFRRNNLIMVQAKDLQRQLQEAWDYIAIFRGQMNDWESAYYERDRAYNGIVVQLHLLEAKLTAIECSDCGLTMLVCECDD